ncbi:MAG: hypothetical protein PWQ79_2258 [Thermococcaceae archaeon]|nr:hypothetical protein [Thermococcaceae archaeon]MDK2915343.1 hypothetical protein [Thermococcaceae archaeon]
MNLREFLEKLIWQENEMYNLHKLGETFATFEKPEFVDTFRLMAEEELRHRKTLESILSDGSLKNTYVADSLELFLMEPMLEDKRAEPSDFKELILEALIREKHAYQLYMRFSEVLESSLGHIFKMMANEELKHGYRLKIMYETLE